MPTVAQKHTRIRPAPSTAAATTGEESSLTTLVQSSPAAVRALLFALCDEGAAAWVGVALEDIADELSTVYTAMPNEGGADPDIRTTVLRLQSRVRAVMAVHETIRVAGAA